MREKRSKYGFFLCQKGRFSKKTKKQPVLYWISLNVGVFFAMHLGKSTVFADDCLAALELNGTDKKGGKFKKHAQKLQLQHYQVRI